MRVLALPLLLAAMACLPMGARAQGPDGPTEGRAWQRLQVDLDRDGSPETVSLVAYQVSESGYFGQLVVTRADGQALWKGPRPTRPEDPMAFGSWDWGGADLQVAGDLDRDGRVELLGALPQSDVRPATFRVLRWNGQAFQPAFSRSLLETPAGSGRYRWTRAPEEIQGLRWIGSFKSTARDGTCVVEVYDMTGASPKLGTAALVPDSQGFHVLRWLQGPR